MSEALQRIEKRTLPKGSIFEIVYGYHDIYADECSEEQWEELDIATKMNFAIVHGSTVGILNPRQTEAAVAAMEIVKKDNKTARVPLPPLGVVFLADCYVADPTFRPDLS